MEESPVETPAFSGLSFLEMEKLNANSRLSIELEFRTFSERGILLYNGQTPAGKGDFVSLAINDGHVEFRSFFSFIQVILFLFFSLSLSRSYLLCQGMGSS